MTYNPKKHHRSSIRLKGYDYSQEGLYFITVCVHDRKCLFGKIENEEMILSDFGKIACREFEKLPMRFSNMELDVFQIMPNHMHAIILLTGHVGAGFTPARNMVIVNDDNFVGAGLAPAHNDAIVNDVNFVGAGFTPAHNDAIVNDVNFVGAGFTPAHNDAIVNDVNFVGAGFTPAHNMVVGRAGASPAPTGKTIGDIIGAYKSLVANQCLEIFKQKNTDEMMGKLWQRNYHEHIIRNEKSYQKIAGYIANNPANWMDDKLYR